MHALVVEAKSFSDTFALVVTGTNANWINAAVIALELGVHVWISIDLTGGSQQQASLHSPSQAEHVVGAEKAGFGGFDWIGLVVDRGGRTGEVPYAIDLKPDRLSDVVTNELKTRVVPPLTNVGLPAGEVLSRQSTSSTASIDRLDETPEIQHLR